MLFLPTCCGKILDDDKSQEISTKRYQNNLSILFLTKMKKYSCKIETFRPNYAHNRPIIINVIPSTIF